LTKTLTLQAGKYSIISVLSWPYCPSAVSFVHFQSTGMVVSESCRRRLRTFLTGIGIIMRWFLRLGSYKHMLMPVSDCRNTQGEYRSLSGAGTPIVVMSAALYDKTQHDASERLEIYERELPVSHWIMYSIMVLSSALYGRGQHDTSERFETYGSELSFSRWILYPHVVIPAARDCRTHNGPSKRLEVRGRELQHLSLV
jgi:hypothetical protein